MIVCSLATSSPPTNQWILSVRSSGSMLVRTTLMSNCKWATECIGHRSEPKIVILYYSVQIPYPENVIPLHLPTKRSRWTCNNLKKQSWLFLIVFCSRENSVNTISSSLSYGRTCLTNVPLDIQNRNYDGKIKFRRSRPYTILHLLPKYKSIYPRYTSDYDKSFFDICYYWFLAVIYRRRNILQIDEEKC